jgi:hypothetical protein
MRSFVTIAEPFLLRSTKLNNFNSSKVYIGTRRFCPFIFPFVVGITTTLFGSNNTRRTDETYMFPCTSGRVKVI